jgi:hypothetical protein
MATSGAKFPAAVTFASHLNGAAHVIPLRKEVAMRSILTKRTTQVLAALGVAAAGIGAAGAAQANDGYWHQRWHHWEHPHYWGQPWAYSYEYAPRYYSPRYYAPRTWAYRAEPYYYGPPSINFTIPLR